MHSGCQISYIILISHQKRRKKKGSSIFVEKEERIQETFPEDCSVFLAPFPDTYEIQGEFGQLLRLHEIF